MTNVWNPFRELDMLRRQVERAFDEFGTAKAPFSRTAFLPGWAARSYPMINMGEDADHVYVEALAPGLNPDTLELSVVRDSLRIAGEKPAMCETVEPHAFHRRERATGKFVRTITLPTLVDGEKVSAEYKNGLLLITLPKAEEAKPKKIAVSVN